jgi:hypothetical protein
VVVVDACLHSSETNNIPSVILFPARLRLELKRCVMQDQAKELLFFSIFVLHFKLSWSILLENKGTAADIAMFI